MNYDRESIGAVLDALKTSETGLSEAEAQRRLAENGENRLQEKKGKSLFMRFVQQLADPMIIILLGAALISGVLAAVNGEGAADVIIILAVVIINAVLGVYQESKAEKAIEALQKMSAATCRVLRDGNEKVIPATLLATGDVILLEAGDAVPADARILSCSSLKAEEAALTGESVPVEKTQKVMEGEKELAPAERKNMLYMGSSVVYGRGRAVVTDIGMQTEMGKIADALQQSSEGQTPLQKKLSQLSRILTRLVLIICAVVFAVQLIKAGSLSFRPVLDSLMIAVSLAVAAIPEGLAAVVTVVLSIGVTNMSRRGAIIRRLTAVETLGCAEIICSDKTGTLTQNKMTVVESFGTDTEKIKQAMGLCNDARFDEHGEIIGEPTEAALFAWAQGFTALERYAEAPFDSERKMMSTVHPDGEGFIQFTKGAPDVILQHCTHVLKNGRTVALDEAGKQEIVAAAKTMADQALRVLACAARTHEQLPDPRPESIEKELCFYGLCGMIDPVRPEVKAAIDECRAAGIRPIMITGDHVDTAVAIGRQLGILREGDLAVTGAQLEEMSEQTFAAQLEKISVYARVQPHHKTRIVNAWKAAGKVTAMTGDGVNDAPSLKAADIGVGMGITGTDVTKNVADMVLSDDNFATIVGAVEEGRRIYDNIRKAIQFLLGSNMSEVLSIFFATMLGFTVLKPVHLLWINLVTDCFPALALGMEKAEPEIMRRKPRRADAGVFSDGLGVDVAYQGVVLTALVMISYFIGHFMETGAVALTDSSHGTTMAFLTMSMAEIFHCFNMRSRRGSIFKLKTQNIALWLAAGASLVLTTVVCEVPFIAKAFDFTAVGFREYITAIALGALIIPIVEAVKWICRRCHRGE